MIKGEGDERPIWAELQGERTGGVEEEEIAGFVVAERRSIDGLCSVVAPFLLRRIRPSSLAWLEYRGSSSLYRFTCSKDRTKLSSDFKFCDR